MGPDPKEISAPLVDGYAWFLEKTALTTDEITAFFNNKEEKKNMFVKGDEFGDLIFKILQDVTKNNNYMRYLVI
jgi:hypothetical protein